MSNEERLRRLFDAAPGLKHLADETLIKIAKKRGALSLSLNAEESAALSAILFNSIGNETLNKIADILCDQGSDFDAGELAVIGATLENLGKIVKEFARLKARRQMGYTNRCRSRGVRFSYRPSRTRQIVRSQAVVERYPVETHPDLYSHQINHQAVIERYPVETHPDLYSHQINHQAVRKRLPAGRHPDLYRESITREQVWVRVPNEAKPAAQIDWRDLYNE